MSGPSSDRRSPEPVQRQELQPTTPMVVDATRLAYEKSHIDRSRSVSGDSIFLRSSPSSRERQVRHRSRREVSILRSPRRQLRTSYLLRGPHPRHPETRLLPGPPTRRREAMGRQLIDRDPGDPAREHKDNAWGSMVKQTMIRKNPAFNESYYGTDVLQAPTRRPQESVSDDGARREVGHVLITALSEDSGRAGSGAPFGRCRVQRRHELRVWFQTLTERRHLRARH